MTDGNTGATMTRHFCAAFCTSSSTSSKSSCRCSNNVFECCNAQYGKLVNAAMRNRVSSDPSAASKVMWASSWSRPRIRGNALTASDWRISRSPFFQVTGWTSISPRARGRILSSGIRSQGPSPGRYARSRPFRRFRPVRKGFPVLGFLAIYSRIQSLSACTPTSSKPPVRRRARITSA